MKFFASPVLVVLPLLTFTSLCFVSATFLYFCTRLLSLALHDLDPFYKGLSIPLLAIASLFLIYKVTMRALRYFFITALTAVIGEAAASSVFPIIRGVSGFTLWTLLDVGSLVFHGADVFRNRKSRTTFIVHVVTRIFIASGYHLVAQEMVAKRFKGFDGGTSRSSFLTEALSYAFPNPTREQVTRLQYFNGMALASKNLTSMLKLIAEILAFLRTPPGPTTEQQITDYVNRVTAFLSRGIGTFTAVDIVEMDQIRLEGIRLQGLFATSDPRLNTPAFGILKREFEDCFQAVRTTLVAHQSRPLPVAIFIQGVGGTGKSTVCEYFSQFIACHLTGEPVTTATRVIYPYSKNANVRMDGVTSDHLVGTFEDMLHTNDTTQCAKEVEMLNHTNDKTTYFPDVAWIKFKRIAMVRFLATVVTSNKEVHETTNDIGVRSPYAFLRRYDFHLSMNVKLLADREAKLEEFTIRWITRRGKAVNRIITWEELAGEIRMLLDARKKDHETIDVRAQDRVNRMAQAAQEYVDRVNSVPPAPAAPYSPSPDIRDHFPSPAPSPPPSPLRSQPSPIIEELDSEDEAFGHVPVDGAGVMFDSDDEASSFEAHYSISKNPFNWDRSDEIQYEEEVETNDQHPDDIRDRADIQLCQAIDALNGARDYICEKFKYPYLEHIETPDYLEVLPSADIYWENLSIKYNAPHTFACAFWIRNGYIHFYNRARLRHDAAWFEAQPQTQEYLDNVAPYPDFPTKEEWYEKMDLYWLFNTAFPGDPSNVYSLPWITHTGREAVPVEAHVEWEKSDNGRPSIQANFQIYQLPSVSRELTWFVPKNPSPVDCWNATLIPAGPGRIKYRGTEFFLDVGLESARLETAPPTLMQLAWIYSALGWVDFATRGVPEMPEAEQCIPGLKFFEYFGVVFLNWLFIGAWTWVFWCFGIFFYPFWLFFYLGWCAVVPLIQTEVLDAKHRDASPVAAIGLCLVLLAVAWWLSRRYARVLRNEEERQLNLMLAAYQAEKKEDLQAHLGVDLTQSEASEYVMNWNRSMVSQMITEEPDLNVQLAQAHAAQAAAKQRIEDIKAELYTSRTRVKLKARPAIESELYTTRERLRTKPRPTEAFISTDSNALDLIDSVSDNVGMVTVHLPDNTVMQGQFIALGGRSFLMNQHTFLGLRTANAKASFWTPNVTHWLSNAQLSEMTTRLLPNDRIVVSHPSFPLCKNIVKHFRQSEELPAHDSRVESRLMIVWRDRAKDSLGHHKLMQRECTGYSFDSTYYELTKERQRLNIFVEGSFKVDVQTIPSMSGCLLVELNPHQPHKILGVLSGGWTAGSSLFIPCPESDLLSTELLIQGTTPESFEAFTGVALDDSNPETHAYLRDNCPRNFKFHGVAVKPSRVSHPTHIHPSPLQEEIVPLTGVALTQPYQDEQGTWISPSNVFFDKSAFSSVAVDITALDHETEIMALRAPSRDPRFGAEDGILSDDIALNGIDGTMLHAIPLDTSPGIRLKKMCRKGKIPYLRVELPEGRNFILLSSKARRDVAFRLKCLKTGTIPILFDDNQKDERYLIEKLKRKFRVVSTDDAANQVVIRKLLGAFLDATRRYQPFGSSMVGINACGPQFDQFVQWVMAYGEDALAMDALLWDFSVPVEVNLRYALFVNLWYLHNFGTPLDSELATQRRNMIYSLVNHFHIFNSFVYQRIGGKASGDPTTAESNGFSNELMDRVIFRVLCPGKTYDDHVRGAYYGDDKLLVVRDAPDFNMMTLAQVARERFGMIWTTDQKVAPTVPYLPLREATFISRCFLPVPHTGLYFGALEKSNIKEMALWCRYSDQTDKNERWRMNCVSSLREMFAYGQEEFNSWKNTLNRCLLKHKVPAILLSYEDVLRDYYGAL